MKQIFTCSPNYKVGTKKKMQQGTYRSRSSLKKGMIRATSRPEEEMQNMQQTQTCSPYQKGKITKATFLQMERKM